MAKLGIEALAEGLRILAAQQAGLLDGRIFLEHRGRAIVLFFFFSAAWLSTARLLQPLLPH
jgi:hypothetical protein